MLEFFYLIERMRSGHPPLTRGKLVQVPKNDLLGIH